MSKEDGCPRQAFVLQPATPIEPDDHDEDIVSEAYLASITQYPFENGRRYHAYAPGQYYFPNDEKEMERQDIEHQTTLLLMDGELYKCPLRKNPSKILDLGTGTGIWCIDMADKFPDCEVIGTDLSPIQPELVPPNCKFYVDNYEDEWTFGTNEFDMIHHRYLTCHISDHASFYRNIYSALKPGGSIELVEIELDFLCDDGSLPSDAALLQWRDLLRDAFAAIGKIIPSAEEFGQCLRTAGFENVHAAVLKRPTNDWPKDPKLKEQGRFHCLNLLQGIEGFAMAPLTRMFGWKPDEVKVLVAKMRKELLNRKIHAYQKGIICYGTKPKTSVQD